MESAPCANVTDAVPVKDVQSVFAKPLGDMHSVYRVAEDRRSTSNSCAKSIRSMMVSLREIHAHVHPEDRRGAKLDGLGTGTGVKRRERVPGLPDRRAALNGAEARLGDGGQNGPHQHDDDRLDDREPASLHQVGSDEWIWTCASPIRVPCHGKRRGMTAMTGD